MVKTGVGGGECVVGRVRVSISRKKDVRHKPTDRRERQLGWGGQCEVERVCACIRGTGGTN